MEQASSNNLEKSCIQRALVVPRWLPGSNSVFWYRRQLSASTFQFILVNCEAGTKSPAFDHDGLAAELQKHTHQRIDPQALPLWWIDVDKGATYVRFEHEGETWQYKDGKLQKWQGGFYKGTLDLGCQETTSTLACIRDPGEVVS